MKTLAIITPTYNRAELLKIAFSSLQKQTNKDFVWYVIDDGSKDNTAEIMEELTKQADFEVVFKRKENGGKHSALNVAFDLIKEEITLILDSDDELLEEAVEIIIKDYSEIKDDDSICGVGYLRCYRDGRIIGKQYTQDGVVDTFTNQRINKNTYGDKCEVFKSKILTKYKFPEFEGENFVSESTIWCEMSLNYKMKFYNKPIYACEYLEGGLSDNVHKRLFKNPKGASACYLSMSSKQTNFKSRFKYSIAYIVYSFAAGIKAKEQFKNISSKFIFVLGFIPAWFIYLKKKRKYKN